MIIKMIADDSQLFMAFPQLFMVRVSSFIAAECIHWDILQRFDLHIVFMCHIPPGFSKNRALRTLVNGQVIRIHLTRRMKSHHLIRLEGTYPCYFYMLLA